MLDLLCPWSSLFLFLFFHSSGGHSLKSKVSAGLCSFSRLGENTSLPIPASGDSKPSLACGYIIPISTFVFMEISLLSFDLFCVIRTSIIEFRGNTDNSGWSHFRILDLITSIKIFFFFFPQIMSHPQDPGGHIFWGTTIQLTTVGDLELLILSVS